MKTYPLSKNISALLVALVITGAGYSQNGDYAVRSTSSSSSSTSRSSAAAITVRARAEKAIVLSWAPFSGAVSHYVLERSLDGRKYEEAGLLFTGEWSEEPQYFYTDKFRRAYTGPLFYRLRVVGLNESVIYTSATISGPEHLAGQRQQNN